MNRAPLNSPIFPPAAAWSMARYMAEKRKDVDITMLYNHQMAVPLSAEERQVSRQLKIRWLPFDGALRPTVQAGYLTYCDPKDHLEYELPWDKLILSPKRSLGVEATKVARVLGLDCEEGKFLEVKQEKVRPEQVGREPLYLAGSARYPCDLHEALAPGTPGSRCKQLRSWKRIKEGNYLPPAWSVRWTSPSASAAGCARRSVIAAASPRWKGWGAVFPEQWTPWSVPAAGPAPRPAPTMP